MEIVKGIYFDEHITDHDDTIKIFLDIKAKLSETNENISIKNQINFIHGL
jgi:hypothetical protein